MENSRNQAVAERKAEAQRLVDAKRSHTLRYCSSTVENEPFSWNADVVRYHPKFPLIPVDSKARSSVAWKFFGVTPENDEVAVFTAANIPRVVCALCIFRDRSAKPQEYPYLVESTDKLVKHLKKHHKFDYNAATGHHAVGESDVRAFFVKPMASHRHKQLCRSLAFMICRDIEPLSIVKKVGFRMFVGDMEQGFNLPDRKTLTRTVIPEMAKEISDKIIEIFQDVPGIALTTDGWTSKTGHHFVAVTAHFVDEQFLQRRLLLKCMECGGSMQDLKHDLESCLATFDIAKEKIKAVTSDNADTQVKAIVQAQLPHTRCFIHTLQLAVQGALLDDVFCFVIDKAKKIIEFFHRSTKATKDLKEEQSRAGISVPLTLKTECKTRWNSLMYALERLLLIRSHVDMALLRSNREDLRLTLVEWTFIEKLVPSLKPFEAATRFFSGRQETLASLVIPTVRALYKAFPDHDEATIRALQSSMKTLENHNALICEERLYPLEFVFVDETQRLFDGLAKSSKRKKEPKNSSVDASTSSISVVSSEMCAMALNKIQKSWGNHLRARLNVFLESSLLRLCTLLDPRVKNRFLLHHEKAMAVAQLVALINQHHTAEAGDASSSTVANTSVLSQDPLNIFCNGIVDDEDATTGYSRAENLVKSYLQCPVDSVDSSSWTDAWKTICKSHPIISNIARQYGAIQATSVDSERVFSISGYTLSERRRRLVPKTVNQLLLIHSNYESVVLDRTSRKRQSGLIDLSVSSPPAKSFRPVSPVSSDDD